MSVGTKQLGGIALIAALIFAIGAFLAGSAGAQSGGCTGTFAGATALDSDVSDADESAAGTDPCEAASVAGATSTQTTTAVSPAVAEPPLLALTGPSMATVLVIFAMLLFGLGAASVVVGNSVDS